MYCLVAVLNQRWLMCLARSAAMSVGSSVGVAVEDTWAAQLSHTSVPSSLRTLAQARAGGTLVTSWPVTELMNLVQSEARGQR